MMNMETINYKFVSCGKCGKAACYKIDEQPKTICDSCAMQSTRDARMFRLGAEWQRERSEQELRDNGEHQAVECVRAQPITPADVQAALEKVDG